MSAERRRQVRQVRQVCQDAAELPVCVSGNDPLIDEESNHDINSVAGVLKLYFRGLENPLFPKERFNDLISCVREWHRLLTADVKQRIRPLIARRQFGANC